MVVNAANNVIIAMKNKEFIHKIATCATMAPSMTTTAIIAPYHAVAGHKRSNPASNSTRPLPILPHGSTHNIVKISTDSGSAQNLK